MKRVLAVIAILLIPAASAAEVTSLPPNYENSDSRRFSCDGGKTVVVSYLNEKESWEVLDIRTGSGDTLFAVGTETDGGFFIKKAGSEAMTALTRDEFFDTLSEKAPNVFTNLLASFLPLPSDCRPAD